MLTLRTDIHHPKIYNVIRYVGTKGLLRLGQEASGRPTLTLDCYCPWCGGRHEFPWRLPPLDPQEYRVVQVTCLPQCEREIWTTIGLHPCEVDHNGAVAYYAADAFERWEASQARP